MQRFYGILILGYILDKLNWIFNIRPFVALPVFPDLVFKSLHVFKTNLYDVIPIKSGPAIMKMRKYYFWNLF